MTVRLKRLKLRVISAQGERLVCEHCRRPFGCLRHRRRTFNVLGAPLPGSDEKMRREVLRRCEEDLRTSASLTRSSRGRCPGCNRYQGWMIRDQRIAAVLVAVVAAVAAGFAGLIVGALAGRLVSDDATTLTWAVGTALLFAATAAVLSLVAGFREEVPLDRKDPRCLSDEGLRDLFERAEKAKRSPMLLWLEEAAAAIPGAGRLPEGAIRLDLGVLDEEGGAVPEEHRTRTVLERLLATTA